MVDTVVEATQVAIVEVTQAVIMVEGGTQVVITAEEDTQVAIMEGAQEGTMATQEVTITATVTAMATVIMAGMVDGVTVTTHTPGESRSMVILFGGGLIRMPILTTPIRMTTLTPMATLTLIRLSSRIIPPRQR